MWFKRKTVPRIGNNSKIKLAISNLIRNLEISIALLDEQLREPLELYEHGPVSVSTTSTEPNINNDLASTLIPHTEFGENASAIETIGCAKSYKPSKQIVFTKIDLIKVLVAASYAHLYLKLHKPSTSLSLIKYLGSTEHSFSAACLSLYSKAEDSDPAYVPLYLIELQNTFLYLLYKLNDLKIQNRI